MSRWLKVDTVLRNVQEEEQAFQLGLDSTPSEINRPVMIDLSRVETYSAMYNREGDEIEDESIVTLYSGIEIRIKMPFHILDKYVRKSDGGPG